MILSKACLPPRFQGMQEPSKERAQTSRVRNKDTSSNTGDCSRSSAQESEEEVRIA